MKKQVLFFNPKLNISMFFKFILFFYFVYIRITCFLRTLFTQGSRSQIRIVTCIKFNGIPVSIHMLAQRKANYTRFVGPMLNSNVGTTSKCKVGLCWANLLVKRWCNIGSRLYRRWPNIKYMLGQYAKLQPLVLVYLVLVQCFFRVGSTFPLVGPTFL